MSLGSSLVWIDGLTERDWRVCPECGAFGRPAVTRSVSVHEEQQGRYEVLRIVRTIVLSCDDCHTVLDINYS